MFSELAYPVIKVAGVDAVLLTPLIIRQPALSAFHDHSNLVIFTNTFTHIRNLFSYYHLGGQAMVPLHHLKAGMVSHPYKQLDTLPHM